MGTVGLNFGSPTSGTGFDVSSTVASIVSNLQNVETPWKSQLTSLESEDTAISSLGTLFSNLSNDMSQLTDLQGVLAEKEGSSSDTNVLTLTNATASAVAGTYTVEVQSLAQTSSGYLTAVNASDTLSGSLTLQVGSSKAQTITLDSSDDTLAGLASAINSSSAGVTANVMPTNSGSVLSLVSGTSGSAGGLTITSNIADANPITLGYSDTGYTSTGNLSTGSLSAVGSTDTLGGSISIGVGSNAAQTVNLADVETAEGGATLANLAAYITSSSSTLGVTASVVTSNGQSTLSLKSNTAGSAGALSVTSSVTDSAPTLGYNSTVTGSNAQMTINGISNLTSSSNTVSNLIPGVTFQLLAPSPTESDGSLEQVQVVIGNDNSGVESTVDQFVSDYNALISAVNAQQGNTSSGTPEPLFGSPTLSLLQQQLMSSLNTQNPDGYLDSVSSAANVTLSGSISISLAGGIPLYYSGVAGTDATDTTGLTTSTGTLAPINNAADTLSGSISIAVGNGATQTVNVGDSSTPDTLAGLAQAITLANIGVSAQVESNATSSWLSLTSSTPGTAGTLSVDSSVADTTTQIIQVPASSGDNTLAGLASAINSSLSGATAAVVTRNGRSTLTLTSEVEGAGGALTVASALASSVPNPLSYSDLAGYTSTTPDGGALGVVAGSGDTLSGSLTIQVGSGTAQTITLDSSNNTLAGLLGAINGLSGVTASLDQAGTGLTLTSATDGAAGALTVTSNLYDSSDATTSTLNYTASSDVNSLTSLGISLNDDGTMTFDDSTLDSLLNSDFNSVTGFFQNPNSWGQSFSNMLNSAGTSSSTGILALASGSNSSIESTLNADVTKENALISAEQTSLTAELNSANEIMQQLPSQLDGMNELYSAITGYNQGANG